MKLKKISNPIIFLKIKELYELLSNEYWNIVGIGDSPEELQFKLAIKKTEEFKEEIKKISELDYNISCNDKIIYKNGVKLVIANNKNNNSYYKGDLDIIDLLGSLENLYEQIRQSDNSIISEIKFISIYNYLTNINDEKRIELLNNYKWNGSKYIFGNHGSISFNKGMRKNIFTELTQNFGEWVDVQLLHSKYRYNKDNIRQSISDIRERISNIDSVELITRNEYPGGYKIIFKE